MKFIAKINMTTKLILLVLYVLVLALVVLLIGSINPTTSIYDNYGVIPGDENMDIAIRLKERRTAPSKETEKETQYWDLQVYLHLKDQEAIYRNVTIYTAILKKDGTMKYEEKSAAILTGAENPSNISESSSDRSIYSSYAITSKTMTYSSSTKEYTKKDGEPDKIYVKVVYEVREEGKENVKKEITYQCDVLNTDEVDFTSFTKTILLKENSYINLKNDNDKLNIKVRTTLSDLTSINDTYRLNVYYEPLDEEGNNTIKNATLALFLGTSNTESDEEDYFSNYIEFAQYYGALPYLYSIHQIATAYNGMFDADNLYIYSEINNTDGTTQKSNVYIPVNELPKY